MDSCEIFDSNSPTLSFSQSLKPSFPPVVFHLVLLSCFSCNKPDQFGFLFVCFFPPPPSFLLHPHPPNPFQCWKQNNLKWKTCDLPSLYLQCHKPQGKDLAKLSSCNGKGREKLALVFAAVIFNTSQQSRMGRGRRIRSLQSWVKRSQSHR